MALSTEQHTLHYIRTVAKQICSAVRQDLGKTIESNRNFVAEFRKRVNAHFASLPEFKGTFTQQDDEAIQIAEGFAWEWYGKEILHLVEIQNFMMQEEVGFSMHEVDEEGSYVDFIKMTWDTDYYLTFSKPYDCLIEYPFRSNSDHQVYVPNEVLVTLKAFGKSRSAENYKERVIFQQLHINIQEELSFLFTLIHKFLHTGDWSK